MSAYQIATLTDSHHAQHGVRGATPHRQDHCPLLLCGIHTGGVPSFGLLVHAGRTILGSSSTELLVSPAHLDGPTFADSLCVSSGMRHLLQTHDICDGIQHLIRPDAAGDSDPDRCSKQAANEEVNTRLLEPTTCANANNHPGNLYYAASWVSVPSMSVMPLFTS